MSAPSLTGLPDDYYRSLFAVEEQHWWHRGMREITRALLGERLARPNVRLLDAGCGTGGFLRWASEVASPARLAGVDLSAEAVALAGARVPAADLQVATVAALPFADGAFDVVFLNDVLQHVHEDELATSVRELGRVLAAGGALLVRTNGARHGRRSAADWRLYDAQALSSVLAEGGLRCERLTYANALGSLWAATRGHGPKPPSGSSHGIPAASPGLAGAVMYRSLALEARFLRRHGRRLPYGHTLLAVAVAGT
jgi:SAM-dependent methyltransferase